MKLGDIADVVRSKNAGIHYITIDVMFSDAGTYDAVKETDVLSASVFAEQYDLPEHEVRFFEYDAGQAFKITLPRSHSVGSPGDRDLYGAQQHAPVITIDIPLENSSER
jgi:hypothetical protein